MLIFSPDVHTLSFETSSPKGLKIFISGLSSIFAAEAGVFALLSDPPIKILSLNVFPDIDNF